MAISPQNLGTARAFNGIENLHTARVTQDDALGFNGHKLKIYPGLIGVTPAYTTQDMNLQADNREYEAESVITGATLAFDLVGLTDEILEYSFGYTRQGAGLLAPNGSGPKTIYKYEATRSDGSSVFTHWGAVRSTPAAETGTTKGSSYQQSQINAAVTAPVNGKLGKVGVLRIDTNSQAFKDLAIPVEQFRQEFFSNFYYDGVEGNTIEGVSDSSSLALKDGAADVSNGANLSMASDGTSGKEFTLYKDGVAVATPLTPADITVVSGGTNLDATNGTGSGSVKLTPKAAGSAVVEIKYGGETLTVPVTIIA